MAYACNEARNRRKGSTMKLIVREDYLEILKKCRQTSDIKVLTGIRRSGKSKLLEAFTDFLERNDPDSHIIRINFNLTDYEDLKEYHSLEAYIENNYIPGKNNVVLIDEVEMCEGFEKAINSLHDREKYDIYITGSNAFLQSSDLATLFVGRTFEITVYPFSFTEYLSYFPSSNLNQAFDDYLQFGGMSGSYVYSDSLQKREYLNKEVLEALIVRDILQKERIRNQAVMERLIDFLMDNIGSLTSVRSITNALASAKEKVDHKTIEKYLSYLCGAFLFQKVRRYDIRGKRYLQYEDKYYLTDHAFRTARLGTRYLDQGRVLENAVAIELSRRGYEVYVGVLYESEIDFVAVRDGRKTYIQVSNDISDSHTRERELSPLLKIKDGYPRILIARTYQPEADYEGIRIIDAAEWFSNPQK